MTEPRPTATSYAVLGLLALRPWTTYELARQTERSLRWFFPRAERAVYLEAKRLVTLGWAEAERTATGRRSSTVYRITPAGRRALAGWLAEPSGPTQIESEGALKVFFADQGRTDELTATIDGMREQAEEALARLAEMAGGASAFPERIPTNVLSMRLISDLHRAVRDWAQWAAGAAEVLARGDEAAIERQTTKALAEIEAAGRPLSSR